MKTLTVDDQKRIRIPDAKPRQVFAYEDHGNGRLTLTLVKFPEGSLCEQSAVDRVTNVDPLPDHVMEQIYSQPDDDPEGMKKFIAAQPFHIDE